jgi:hypothetical protein
MEYWSVDSGGKLLGLLVTGELQAWRADVSAKTTEVPRKYWESREGRGLCMCALNEIEGKRGLPIFQTAELRALLPSRSERQQLQDAERRARREQRARSASATAAAKNTGGAPTKIDWEGMWIEVARILYEERKFAGTRAEFQRRLLDWFATTGRHEPGETIMRKKMKALFDILRPEG